jgi:hypothetical protein
MVSFAITYGMLSVIMLSVCRGAFSWPERPVAIHKVIVADS